jgi:hypothetical protein
MTLCREHHFGSDKRCTYCQMQERYYVEGIATLKTWTQTDIDSCKHDYEFAVDLLMCKAHSHDENLLQRLFDMEG